VEARPIYGVLSQRGFSEGRTQLGKLTTDVTSTRLVQYAGSPDNQEVVTLESFFLLVESSTCATAYLILSVLLV